MAKKLVERETTQNYTNIVFFFANKTYLNFFPPEIVKSCGVDLLSKNISDGGICHNISMKKRQTQSQQSEMKQNDDVTVLSRLGLSSSLSFYYGIYD